MPSAFALQLCEQLCRFLSISATNDERLSFQNAIDFHAKYLPDAATDDLASLLFLECAEEANQRNHRNLSSSERPLQVADLRRLLSRVQKRLYRDARSRRHPPSDLIDTRQTLNRSDPLLVERVLSDFRAYIATTLSPRDGDIFEARFMKGQSVSKICDLMKLEKSTIYDRISVIKKLFIAFLEDVGYPGFHND